ncbi:MAG: ATP-binding protein [Bacillota bacterium]
MINPNFKELKLILDSLSVYRNLLEDGVIKALRTLIDSLSRDKLEIDEFVNFFNTFFFELTKSNSTKTLKDYIIDLVIFDENPYSRLAESVEFEEIDDLLVRAVIKDLDGLNAICVLTSDIFKDYALKNICIYEFEENIINNLPSWEFQNKYDLKTDSESGPLEEIKETLQRSSSWSQCIGDLSGFYRRNGSGMFARCRAFVWEPSDNVSYLRGIDSPDPVRISDFIGYEQERFEVINNTEKFLKGYPANNVLLYGDRGTGKSSTVKALVNEYHQLGLRMIEIPKMHLADFPKVIRLVKDRKLKFIIFIDDLAFEDSEESYTALKAILEGGLECKPDNTLIYATSNRRHLIKEKFSDRAGFRSDSQDDEIRARDTIQEKLSLSDRFGITVVFSSPDQKRFLEIIEGLSKKRGMKIEREKLYKEALKWELWYNGRSPRTAKQFTDWLEGNAELF